MSRLIEHPSFWRVCLAFLVAPLGSILLLLVSLGSNQSIGATATTLGGVIVYPWAILVGAPVYFVSRRFATRSFGAICLLAGCVALFPYLFLLLSQLNLADPWSGLNSWDTVSATLFLLAGVFFLGGFGGAVFWMVLFLPLLSTSSPRVERLIQTLVALVFCPAVPTSQQHSDRQHTADCGDFCRFERFFTGNA